MFRRPRRRSNRLAAEMLKSKKLEIAYNNQCGISLELAAKYQELVDKYNELVQHLNENAEHANDIDELN